MEKLLVEITSPAANLTYDMLLPRNIRIGAATGLIASVLSRLSNGMYEYAGAAVLCEKDTGEEFDPNLLVRDAGIRNGTKLLIY